LIYDEIRARDVHRGGASDVEQRIGRGLEEGRPAGASAGRVGAFDLYPDGLRISRDSEFVGSSGDLFGVICSSGDLILCAAAGTLDGQGVGHCIPLAIRQVVRVLDDGYTLVNPSIKTDGRTDGHTCSNPPQNGSVDIFSSPISVKTLNHCCRR
jgi:hypothetical protein